MNENITPVTKHDAHCELRPFHVIGVGLVEGAPESCRCAERAHVKSLLLEVGTAGSISDEAQDGAVDPVAPIEVLMRGVMRSLIDRVRAEGRVPVLSTLHLIGEHDPYVECNVVRFAMLTLPAGMSPVDIDVLNVTEEWMSTRGLRS